MRAELVDYLRGLSDKKYQYASWVIDHRPGGGHDQLDLSIHFLYDDTSLATNPESWIGAILYNKYEAQAVKHVTESIDKIFDKYGLNLTDKEYIEKPEWDEVIENAKKAYLILKNR